MSATAQNATNTTGQTFLTAFVINGALLVVQVGAFLILKQRLGRIYSPRTYLPPPDKRAEELPGGPWRWFPAILLSNTEEIIHKNGLDAYMFLRFLKMLVWIFLVFTMLTWAVLLPVNAAGIKGVFHGLDTLSWSNISGADNQERYAAHIIIVYILTFFILFMIRREMLHFVHMRHHFLISKSHSRLPQARTVLMTSVPEELANEKDLRTFANFVPGGVDRVWIYRDTKELNHIFEARGKACQRLEVAAANVLRQATIAWNARCAKTAKKVKPKDEERAGSDKDVILPPAIPTHEFLNDLVPRSKRPHHRIGKLGLFGQNVDTIDWCKDEISRLNKSIADRRKNIVKGQFLGSVFVRCNIQLGAHVLAQCVSYHEPFAMYNKWLEANPKDIVWANLDDGAAETTTRYVISWLVTIGLIILWAFPVAFVGTLSKLDQLCQDVHWLRWICKTPAPVPGLIQGVLPPLILTLLFIILPYILQGLAWYEVIPRWSLISVSVYKRYFFFLLFHGFVTVTLASSITTTIERIIDHPAQTVQELASRVPGASIFFMTYLAVQGLAGAGKALIQLVPLLLYFVRKWFMGRTPRQAYAVTFMMPFADFGIVLPQLSLLATIGFAYSVIAPIINGLALLSFFLFYLTWKFLLTQVFDQPDESETGGLYFPMAISNLFVGLYIEQITLACLFFLRVTITRSSSIAEGVLMLVLLAITVAAQIIIHRSFDPITDFLPMSLAMKKASKKAEKRRERERRNLVDITEDIAEEFDIFKRERMRSVRRRLKLLPKQKSEEHPQEKKDIPTHDDPSLLNGEHRVDPSGSTTATAVKPLTNGVQNLSRKTSTSSHLSKASKAPKSSMDSKASNKAKKPVFDPAAPALSSDSELDSDDESDDDDFDEHAFDHPSTYVDQPWIWVPKDALGLSEVLIADMKEAGVDASNVGAVMDEKGVVGVTRNPPDEDWSGGHDG